MNDDYMVVKVEQGAKAGQETKLQTAFVINNKKIYEIK